MPAEDRRFSQIYLKKAVADISIMQGIFVTLVLNRKANLSVYICGICGLKITY